MPKLRRKTTRTVKTPAPVPTPVTPFTLPPSPVTTENTVIALSAALAETLVPPTPTVITKDDLLQVKAWQETIRAGQAAEKLLSPRQTEIVKWLEAGIPLAPDAPAVAIATDSRRNVAWKDAYIKLAGAEAAEKMLVQTTPTVYKKLVINGDRSTTLYTPPTV